MDILSLIIVFILIMNLMNTMLGEQLYDDCSNICYILFGPKEGIFRWQNYYACLMHCLHREPWRID